MPSHRLVTALREVFARPDDAVPMGGASVPAVPAEAEAPDSWRSHTAYDGPYPRFAVRYPRDWSVLGPGDPLHLQPPDDFDVAVTITTAPVGVSGPMGMLDAFETLAEARGLVFDRRAVLLDRWGEDGWAGSWAWTEREGGAVRSWWILLLGHDQHLVYAMANGSVESLFEVMPTIRSVFGSLRLPPSDRLAPEQFPLALCQLLNDRRSDGDVPWSLEGQMLVSGGLVIQLGDLYRGYLLHGDLEETAAALDLRQHPDPQDQYGGRDWRDLEGRLRVVLRRAEAVQELDIVCVPQGHGVVACPVLDSSDRMTFIPRVEADRWGVTPLDLLTRAIARLDSSGQPELEEIYDESDERLLGFRLAAGDGYDSGRLLGPRLQKWLTAALGGRPIIAMPAAGYVLILRDEGVWRQRLAETAAQGFGRRPRPLSGDLWTWSDAGLVPLMP